MNIEKNSIDLEIDRKVKREQRLRFRSILLIAVVLIFSIAWAAITDRQIRQYGQTISKLKDTISHLQQTLDSASNISRHIVDVNLMDVKELYGRDPKVASIISEMLELKSYHTVKFDYNADDSSATNNVFSSPSMMIFILKARHFISKNVRSKGDLEASLKVRPIDPNENFRSGDILFYQSGYVMLYANNPYTFGRSTHFCIGMTPFGILALDPQFANPILVGRPDYDVSAY